MIDVAPVAYRPITNVSDPLGLTTLPLATFDNLLTTLFPCSANPVVSCCSPVFELESLDLESLGFE
jgi:hypothetical protein